jgi:hypothetical protein
MVNKIYDAKTSRDICKVAGEVMLTLMREGW